MIPNSSMLAVPMLEPMTRAFRQAAGRWAGCDWPTTLGRSGLNVKNLRAGQALLLARATSGREADDWWAVFRWLTQVEEEARQAEAEARHALAQAHAGNLDAARECVQRACAIEARYHKRLVWQPLRDVIEAASSAAVCAD